MLHLVSFELCLSVRTNVQTCRENALTSTQYLSQLVVLGVNVHTTNVFHCVLHAYMPVCIRVYTLMHHTRNDCHCKSSCITVSFSVHHISCVCCALSSHHRVPSRCYIHFVAGFHFLLQYTASICEQVQLPSRHTLQKHFAIHTTQTKNCQHTKHQTQTIWHVLLLRAIFCC